jgi:hypothetical protein
MESTAHAVVSTVKLTRHWADGTAPRILISRGAVEFQASDKKVLLPWVSVSSLRHASLPSLLAVRIILIRAQFAAASSRRL